MKTQDELYDEIWAFLTKCAQDGIEKVYLSLREKQLVGRKQGYKLLKDDTLTITFHMTGIIGMPAEHKLMLVDDDE
jgi:hypothetical protein